jgi:Kelch motif/Galactose oxidase, central domain
MTRITKLIASSWIALGAIALTTSVHAETGQWTTHSGPPDVLENGAVLSLSNGKVILAGGILSAGRNTAASAEVEVYDPGKDTWAQLAPMPVPQYSATAVLLADGSVLVAGGYSGIGANSFSAPPPSLIMDAVLFDPAKNTWAKVAPMPFAETGATATVLGDGRILLAGGRDANGALQRAAIFDPSNRLWALTAPMRTARYGAAAVLLKNGKVLVAGGVAGPGQTLNDAELYDPKTSTWSSAGTMSIARSPAALRLPDGRVLLAGGGGGGLSTIASAEFYDPSSGSWHETTPMPISGSGQAFLLASGDVLVLLTSGGDRTIHSALFNTRTTDWAKGPDLRVSSPYPPAESQLPDGTVLVLGGGTLATFGNASVPPPNAATIATKAANSSTTTIVLAIAFVVLLLALGMVYVWQRRRTSRGSS